MMHKKLIYTFIIIMISGAALFAQEDTVIAKVGPQKITINEFRERFELTPQVYSKVNNPYTKEEDMMYSVIAEKLWALEAEKQGYDTTEIMRKSFKALEKMYVRDALYKTEIGDRVRITEKDMIEGMKDHFITLKLKVLRSPDSSAAYEWYGQLKAGVTFDSLMPVHRDTLPEMTVNYGGMLNDFVEDSLYKLNDGEYTAPLKSATGWLIFKLEDKIKKSYTSEDVDNSLEKVKGIIEKRKAKVLYNDYMNKFFDDKKVETVTPLFRSIARKVTKILDDKRKAESIPDTSFVYFKEKDLYRLQSELGPDTLNMVFIKFKKDPYTVDDFLKYFIFEGFYTKFQDFNSIAAQISGRVRTSIEEELLAREGYRRGLENSPKVQREISMWRDYYLAQMLKDKIIDTIKVSEQEVKNYYKQQQELKKDDEVQVDIVEILNDTLSVLKKLKKEIENGADIRKLASLHTKRKWTRAKGGEFGYFQSTMYGVIGEKARAMKVGELYGPVKTPVGYSLFKLIGKKTPKVKAEPFAKVRNKMWRELHGKKVSRFFIAYTVKLANQFGVSIDNNLLKSLSLPDLSMYAYRYMGFGGRIAAVPATLPFIEWYKPWKNGEKIVP